MVSPWAHGRAPLHGRTAVPPYRRGCIAGGALPGAHCRGRTSVRPYMGALPYHRTVGGALPGAHGRAPLRDGVAVTEVFANAGLDRLAGHLVT